MPGLSEKHFETIVESLLLTGGVDDPEWWGNQKQGLNVETIPWIDAGWLVSE